MEEKKLYCNTDTVTKIVSRVIISMCSQLDQLGYKMADKLAMQDALTIKGMIDSEISNSKRSIQNDLKDYVNE